MNFISSLVDLIVHFDQHLIRLSTTYHSWLFIILFLIIFCETGLVITPILPGDSLLFITGTIAASGVFDIDLVAITLIIAAILGDSVNYQIGKTIKLKISDSSIIKNKYFKKTHKFYKNYGGKTIFIARFIPILRTFAPFIAGIGEMTYARFFIYNTISGIVWVTSFLYTGYFFGNFEIVKKNFNLLIFSIILISLTLIVLWIIRQYQKTLK